MPCEEYRLKMTRNKKMYRVSKTPSGIFAVEILRLDDEQVIADITDLINNGEAVIICQEIEDVAMMLDCTIENISIL